MAGCDVKPAFFPAPANPQKPGNRHSWVLLQNSQLGMPRISETCKFCSKPLAELFPAQGQPDRALGQGSIRTMVRRGRDTEALHFVEQGSALQAEPRGRSSRATKFPICALTCSEDFLTDFVLERGI